MEALNGYKTGLGLLIAFGIQIYGAAAAIVPSLPPITPEFMHLITVLGGALGSGGLLHKIAKGEVGGGTK